MRTRELKIDVPDGISGDWAVETYTITKEGARLENLRARIGGHARGIYAGEYKRLRYRDDVVMSNTPAELEDLWEYEDHLRGSVLLNGLGLGVAAKLALLSPVVEKITVIEKSEDVIKLCGRAIYYDLRVEIINADAFEWVPPKGIKYDVVWHDIWNNICSDNLEGMKKLHRKYGRRCVWQGSWCRAECEERAYA